jgi:hypothetical protein
MDMAVDMVMVMAVDMVMVMVMVDVTNLKHAIKKKLVELSDLLVDLFVDLFVFVIVDLLEDLFVDLLVDLFAAKNPDAGDTIKKFNEIINYSSNFE